jgi:hypothetical protein
VIQPPFIYGGTSKPTTRVAANHLKVTGFTAEIKTVAGGHDAFRIHVVDSPKAKDTRVVLDTYGCPQGSHVGPSDVTHARIRILARGRSANRAAWARGRYRRCMEGVGDGRGVFNNGTYLRNVRGHSLIGVVRTLISSVRLDGWGLSRIVPVGAVSATFRSSGGCNGHQERLAACSHYGLLNS